MSTISIRALKKEDKKALWEWRNDIYFNTLLDKDAPTWEEHSLWFDKTYHSPNVTMGIATMGALRIGSIMITDIKRINLFLKPQYCNKNLMDELKKSAYDFLSSQVNK